MLTELRISNFALIDHLHLEFPSGFLVLTGETGAGKSLLIDALVLLTGGRASAEHIRFGAEETLLEASFLLQPAHPLIPQLQEGGYLLPDQSQILIRRIVSRTGKNRNYINGQLAPLQLIQDVGGQLVDIHGQHDQQSLLSPKTQLNLLDAFGNLEDLVHRYQQAYREWGERKRLLEELLHRVKDQTARRDVIQYQYDELEKLQLQPGEDERLQQEYDRLKHGVRLGHLSHQAYSALYEGERSILEQLGDVTKDLQELAQIDTEGTAWLPMLETASVALRDVTASLRDYQTKTDHDPERMEEIDHRLADLQRVKKKYGKSLEELADFTRTLEKDLTLLQDSETQIASHQSEVTSRFDSMQTLGRKLTAERQRVAAHLADGIQREFQALKMDAMEVRIHIEKAHPDDSWGPTGKDRVEILLAPNPGEPLMPLSRIASGGELSRIMLALKTVFAGHDQTPVVIFDEIDNGVGGEAGMIMGSHLRELARFHQVCCVTHLPQIASYAHSQFVVEKSVIASRTLTQVQEVTGVKRQEEIARMLGGGVLTPTLKKTAQELLEQGAGSPSGGPGRKRGKRSANT